jgi:SHS2 domain-containing protein
MLVETLMARDCRTFDHTADVGLTAWADSLGELLAALAEGLTDVICVRSRICPAAVRKLDVEAQDPEALAVDFLSRILYVFAVEGFLLAEASVRVLAGGGQGGRTAISAELAGETYDADRHEIRTEVKAVTYHQLKIAPEGGRWVGRVILDL